MTDHRPLLWLHKLRDPITRLARWKILLREYEYELIHKPGKINMNADALSRNPIPTPHPDYERQRARSRGSIT